MSWLAEWTGENPGDAKSPSKSVEKAAVQPEQHADDPERTGGLPTSPSTSPKSAVVVVENASVVKHRGDAEAMVPGQEEEAFTNHIVRGTQSSRAANYMGTKGKLTSRAAKMFQSDADAENAEREAFNTRRNTARKSARNAATAARLHPLVTSRPKPQRWKKRPDDWKHEADALIAHTHSLWGDVDVAHSAELAGRPPRAQRQKTPSPHRYGQEDREMSEQERAYQLEKQLEVRERKLQAKLKAEAKEAKAVQQQAEKDAGLEWYHRQRDRAAKGLKKTDRKQAQERLYSSPPKTPKKGLVYG